jgi:hypothetical protein
MKTLAALAAVALLLIAAVAHFAPATLVAARLAAATQGQLRMADASGTVRSGRGVITSETSTWSLPVGWDIDRWSLAHGNMVVALSDPGGGDMPRGTLAWRNGALSLEGIAFSLPAAALGGALAASSLVAFGGQVTFDAPHFSWTGTDSEGFASARWTGARIAGNAGTLALGTVTINLTPRDGGVAGRIENRGGDIRVDGELALGTAGNTASVTLSPLPSTPPATTRALSALGTPDATGAVRVQWRSGTR